MTIRKIDSVGELTQILNSCGCDFYLLGEDSQSQGNVYLYECFLKKRILVGLISENNGLTPAYYIVNDSLVLGYNSQVGVIDENGYKKIIDADSFFYEFLFLDYAKINIAVFELEVVSFSINGGVIWRHFTHDIIVNYYTIDNNLYLITDSGIEIISL